MRRRTSILVSLTLVADAADALKTDLLNEPAIIAAAYAPFVREGFELHATLLRSRGGQTFLAP